MAEDKVDATSLIGIEHKYAEKGSKRRKELWEEYEAAMITDLLKTHSDEAPRKKARRVDDEKRTYIAGETRRFWVDEYNCVIGS